MRFISVCSGIEAASVAAKPLGWQAVAFSEIEPFPCSLLAHHYPDTPNWGDMTKFKEWPDVSIDLLCGGTPCQSFSVAGLRKGLDDPRGNLMLTFGAIAAKYRPKWLVWENVPGVLSSNGGRDFGAFLGMLGQLGYGFAYRILDAQYFGVAQRRRRVFVVGCLGDWRSAAAVLFERHSLQGHPAPSRQAGQRPTGTLSARTEGGGGLGTDFELGGGLQVAGTMKSCKDSGGWSNSADHAAAGYMVPVETLCIATGQAGAEIGAEMAPTLNCNHEAPYAMYASSLQPCEFCGYQFDHDKLGRYGCPNCEGEGLGCTHTLRGEGFDASEDGTGRGTPLVPVVAGALCKDTYSGGMGGRPESAAVGHVLPVCFSAQDNGRDATELIAPTMRKGGDGGGVQLAVAVSLRGREGGATAELGGDLQNCLRASNGGGDKPHVLTAMQVRRLTPEECEALQGFPRGYTAVPHRGKQAADGPRYKALGNSWAVPNVRWIFQRIDLVSNIKQMSEAA